MHEYDPPPPPTFDDTKFLICIFLKFLENIEAKNTRAKEKAKAAFKMARQRLKAKKIQKENIQRLATVGTQLQRIQVINVQEKSSELDKEKCSNPNSESVEIFKEQVDSSKFQYKPNNIQYQEIDQSNESNKEYDCNLNSESIVTGQNQVDGFQQKLNPINSISMQVDQSTESQSIKAIPSESEIHYVYPEEKNELVR